MPERLTLPQRPAGGSLAGHVAALDLLAARLDILPTRSRWPVRVPINSKASFDGDVVHTDEVKVHLGGDEWAEMSAHEAGEYVRKRKNALLEQQAMMTEGQEAKPVALPTLAAGQSVIKTEEIRFDSLLAHPVGQRPAPAAKSKSPAPEPVSREIATSTDPSFRLKDARSQGKVEHLPQSLQEIIDLVGGELQDKLSIPNSDDQDEEILNNEGLPIHEIRENPDGSLLGPMPQPQGEGSVTVADTRDDNYWDPEAERRRAALRRRIFNEDSDSSDEDEAAAVSAVKEDKMDVDPPAASQPSVKVEEPTPTEDQTSLQETNKQYPELHNPWHTDSSKKTSLTSEGDEHPAKSPRSPLQPKSILKTPIRKKSVSFDASVPLPPDSPPILGQNSNIADYARRLGMPVEQISDQSEGKRIPTLAQPVPGVKASGSGLRAVPPGAPEVNTSREEDPKAQEKGKKPSLFAQRRAEAAPSLPKLSEAKPMTTMKMQVVEKPLGPPPTVGSLPPSASASSSAPGPPSAQPPVVVINDDSDPEDYGDLGEFSDDEEDEYMLDEALMQREIALEFHRRRQPVREFDEDEFDPEAVDTAGVVMGIPRVSTVTGGSEADPLRIVNPTPDDLSQFLRVGRGEDGELVFEQPLVDSGSESEGGEDDETAQDRRARRERKKEVMARLLSGDYEEMPAVEDKEAQQKLRVAQFTESLPPTVTPSGPALAPTPETTATPEAATPEPISPSKRTRPDARDVVERLPPPENASPDPEAVEPPKKVSRFKAARQAQ